MSDTVFVQNPGFYRLFNKIKSIKYFVFFAAALSSVACSESSRPLSVPNQGQKVEEPIQCSPLSEHFKSQSASISLLGEPGFKELVQHLATSVCGVLREGLRSQDTFLVYY